MTFFDLGFDPVGALGADPVDVASAFDTSGFDFAAIEQFTKPPALSPPTPAPRSTLQRLAEGTREGLVGSKATSVLTALALIPSPIAPVARVLGIVNRAAGAIRSLGEGRSVAAGEEQSAIVPIIATIKENVGGTPVPGIFGGITDFLGGATSAVTQVGGLLGAVGSLFGNGPNSGAIAAAPANATGFVAQPAIFRLPMPRTLPRLPAPRQNNPPGLPLPTLPSLPELPPMSDMSGQDVICRPATRRGSITQFLRAAGYNWKTASRLVRLVGPEVMAAVTGLDLGSAAYILANPPRRRGAGISSTDIRRTRSTLTKLNRLNKLCAPVRRRR